MSSPTTFVHLTSSASFRVFSGAYDIQANDPCTQKRYCRAIAVPSGGVVVTGTDGVNVTLPDMGGPWQWDIQAAAIVSGAGIVLW